jgi:hypothetical protein
MSSEPALKRGDGCRFEITTAFASRDREVVDLDNPRQILDDSVSANKPHIAIVSTLDTPVRA